MSKCLNTLGHVHSTTYLPAASSSVTPEALQLPAFEHKSLGMLAYIGSDRAIADFPWGARFGGFLTYWFWRSAYLSNLFSVRNKVLVAADWTKKTVFGRDIGRE